MLVITSALLELAGRRTRRGCRELAREVRGEVVQHWKMGGMVIRSAVTQFELDDLVWFVALASFA